MNPEHKKYILENMGRKSAARIASELGIRQRKVKRVIEMEREKGGLQGAIPQETLPGTAGLPINKTFVLVSVALVIILGFAVYANSLNGKFVYDDEILVKNNAFIKDWSNLPKFFSEDIGKGYGITYSFYRPIQIITYAIDYSVWKLSVIGYHLTNVILHILVALCIYWLISILFEDKIISILTAALFVVHPVHTTIVCYISSRSDSIYLVFMLISFVFYIKSTRGEGLVPYLIMISSYSLSLLSRENALIFPALILLYHYTFKEKMRLREFLSVTGAAFIYILLRATVLKHLLSSAVSNSNFLQRIPGFFAAVAAYVRLMFLPFGLHMEYGKPLFNFADPGAILGLVILAALIFCIIKTAKTNRLIFFSLSWFIITLLPVSNLYPINAYMSESWLYLPSIGFFLILAGFMGALYKKEKYRKAAMIFAACLLAFYSVLTFMQNRTWADPLLFYERTIKYAPDSPRAYNNLANIYAQTGRKEEVIPMYEKVIKLNPRDTEARNNLANLYDEMGRKEEAIVIYKKAIEVDPGYAITYNNLGVTYDGMGKKEDAILMYKKAIEANPNYADAYNNLASAYYKIDKKEDAVIIYKKTIELNPDNAEAYNNLGIVYFNTGRQEEAVAAFKKALEIDPDHAGARRNLDAITAGSKQEAPQ